VSDALRGALRASYGASAVCYALAMDGRGRLTKAVEEAERELDAARTLTALNAAKKKLQRARSELKALETESAERPKRRPSRGRGSAGDAS
jgi:predicted O-methyltransferase YrrM